MIIYLDIVVLENIFINYLILRSILKILKLKTNILKLIISSTVGSILGILGYILNYNLIFEIIYKILLSLLIVYICFGFKEKMIKKILYFYLISMYYGGFVFSFLFMFDNRKINIIDNHFVGIYSLQMVILSSIMGYLFLGFFSKYIYEKLIIKNEYYFLKIIIKDETIIVKALLDTGNFLKDPITNLPVIIVEERKIKIILNNAGVNNINDVLNGIYLGDNLSDINFRIIPFNTVGNEKGVMLGVKPDQIIVEDGKSIDGIIGIFDGRLSYNNEYNALMGLIF